MKKERNEMFLTNIILLFLFVGLCSSVILMGTTKNKATKELNGETYYLRQLNSENQKGWSASGGFFLFFGGFNAGSYEKQMVEFSFNVKNEYIICKIPIEKTRFVIDDKIVTPYVKFYFMNFQKYGNGNINYNSSIDNSLNYAVIHCNNNQFPQEYNAINL